MTTGIRTLEQSQHDASTRTLLETTPSFSVVVCTRNRPDLLSRCLASLSAVTYPRFDVLIVDNAPVDSRAREVAAHWGARYVIEPVAGLSRARNRGARASSSDLIAFTDDDAVVDPEWLWGLVTEFTDARVIAVTGRILTLGSKDRSDSDGCGLGAHRRIIERTNPLWFEMASFGGIGDGGNMAFRRCVFDMWPGFDERLGRGTLLHGGEEQRAFCSMIEHGYRVVYAPQAVVYHPVPSSLQEIRREHLQALSASTAFMTLLILETPHRWRVIKYTFEAMCGKRRAWRGPSTPVFHRSAPRWRTALACLAGPVQYFRTRRARPMCH